MPQPTQNEQWRAIKGYEGFYEVSDRGRVRSLDRMVLGFDLSFHYIPGRNIVLQKATKSEHLSVRLHRDGQKEYHQVHRLVLESFHRPAKDGEVCRHLDGDATNNHIGNLTWGTMSENGHDRVRHGTHPFASRTHCPRGHELRSPNLRPSALKKGTRTCLACDRAKAYARKYGLMGQFKEIADDRYRQIMQGHERGQEGVAA